MALSALSAGVTEGLPAGDMLFTTAGTIENTIVRAAVANALTQGIAVATGRTLPVRPSVMTGCSAVYDLKGLPRTKKLLVNKSRTAKKVLALDAKTWLSRKRLESG